MPQLAYSRVAKSYAAPGSTGKTRLFPTRGDYLAFLAEHGLSDLEKVPYEIISEVQQDWHGRNQHGCAFAAMLSKQAREGWGTVVVPARDGEKWSQALVQEVQDAVSMAEAEAGLISLSLLFPFVSTAAGVVLILSEFRDQLKWQLDYQPLPNTDGSLVQALLRMVLAQRGADNIQVESWAVGFGPFEFLPSTRRAPFVEIAIAVKAKVLPMRSARLNADPRTAHLADVPVPVDDRTFEVMWRSTVDALAEKRGAEKYGAKAKTTLIVPFDMITR